MSRQISIVINGKTVVVSEGTTVAAALLNNGYVSFRESGAGEARAPLCGMGVCFECRVTINQVPHRRACMVACQDNMEVITDG
jgi:predicted molibdopterin-dependent oxidoreductase YjgC